MRGPLLLTFILSLSLAGCKSPPNLITAAGIPLTSLGEPYVFADRITWPRPPRDTSMSQGDYHWNAVLLPYEKGFVLVECVAEGSEVVDRIRVYTPELQARKGLRVGDAVSQMQKTGGRWFITWLSDYQLFELTHAKMPGIHFIVQAPGTSPETSDIRAFGAEARIVCIAIL